MKKILLFLFFAPFVLSAQNFWTEVAPFGDPMTHYPRQISIVSPSVIWAWGSGANFTNFISRSTDEGQTWVETPINLNSSTAVSSMHAVSATTAFISTFANDELGITGVWRTTDSGATWNQVGTADLSSTIFANFLHFFDATNGLIVSDPNGNGFEIFRTSNAGTNWTEVSTANIPAALPGEYGYTTIYRTKNNSIWFGTNKGRIYYSDDAGASWSVTQTPLSDFQNANNFGSFDFRSTSEGLLISNNYEFYRTADGGTTWNLEAPSGIYRNNEMIYVTGTNNTYFSIGENAENQSRGSSYSTDGGQNWIDLNTADADPVLPITAKFASGTVGFCIGSLLSDLSTLRFFRLTDPLNRLLKNDTFANIKFTATPNPTSGMVKFSGADFSSATICDVSGKVILTQHFDKPANASIDLSGFQSGIYLAKIQDANGNAATLKLIKN